MNITYNEFEYYIKQLMKDWDWVDDCLKIGFDVCDHTFGIDFTVELLAKAMHDTDHLLSEWAFEDNFGRDTDVTISDIYNILCDNAKENEYV